MADPIVPEQQPEVQQQPKAAEAVKAAAETARDIEALKIDMTSLENITNNRFETYNAPAEREKSLGTLRKASIKKIRTDHQLVNEITAEDFKKLNDETKIKNTKSETAKRLAAYTTRIGSEFTLNYTFVGGHAHEMGIGLGDILLDEDIEQVEITKGDKKIIAHRGFTSKGRPAFLDENGNYVTTFTGDKFRILSKEETDDKKPERIKNYNEKLSITNTNLKTHLQEMESPSYSKVSDQFSNFKLAELEKESQSREKEKIPTHELKPADIEDAHQKAQKYTKGIESFKDLETKNLNLYKIIDNVCSHFGIPRALMYATIKTESAFRAGTDVIGDKHTVGGSVGIAQFQPGTWDETSAKPEFIEFMNKYYPAGTKFERGANVLADVAASATLMKATAKTGGIDLSANSLSNGDVVFIRARYKGDRRRSNLRERAKDGDPLPPEYTKFLVRYRQYELGQETLNKHKLETTEYISSTRVYDLKPNQETWVLGSSIAIGFRNAINPNKVGTFGIQGASIDKFQRQLAGQIEEMKKIEPKPSRIILMGFAVNGLDRNGSNLNQQVEAHLKMIGYLKNQLGENINIKIAETHPWSGISKSTIKDFNQEIAKKGLLVETKAQSTELHPNGEYKNWVQPLGL